LQRSQSQAHNRFTRRPFAIAGRSTKRRSECETSNPSPSAPWSASSKMNQTASRTASSERRPWVNTARGGPLAPSILQQNIIDALPDPPTGSGRLYTALWYLSTHVLLTKFHKMFPEQDLPPRPTIHTPGMLRAAKVNPTLPPVHTVTHSWLTPFSLPAGSERDSGGQLCQTRTAGTKPPGLLDGGRQSPPCSVPRAHRAQEASRGSRKKL